MPQWWQEPHAHAQLDALPYCMHLLNVQLYTCNNSNQWSQAAALCTQAEQYLQ